MPKSKQIIITLLFSLISIKAYCNETTNNSREKDQIYIDVKGGINNTYKLKGALSTTKLKNSQGFQLALGYSHDNFINTDISVISGNNIKLSANSILNNVYFDDRAKLKYLATFISTSVNFNKNHDISPYIGGGIGYSKNDFGVTNVVGTENGVAKYYGVRVRKSHSSFAWHGTAGINFKLNNNVSLIAEYKYLDLGKIKTSDQLNYYRPIVLNDKVPINTSRFRSNLYMIGLRYKF